MQNSNSILQKLSSLLLIGALLIPSTSLAESALPVSESEAIVREQFADIPAMIDIAKCESGFRQYADSGNVFRGGAGGKMLGVFQLHSDYHLEPANSMGLDITSLEGNLAYARHLYESEGLEPWRPCLGAVTVASVQTPSIITKKLTTDERSALIKRIEELQLQVYILQIELLKLKLSQLGLST